MSQLPTIPITHPDLDFILLREKRWEGGRDDDPTSRREQGVTKISTSHLYSVNV